MRDMADTAGANADNAFEKATAGGRFGNVRKPRQAREAPMFDRIVHANDGSEPAFHALSLALAIAKQNQSEIHMVAVEEIDYVPEFIEEVREEIGTAARRFHKVLQRARAMAEERQIKLHTHVLAGHPVRDIVEIAEELDADLLIIGSKGHSRVYDRLIGSRANRIMHLAKCPVLIVK